jgi:putative tryptophan/tyrosine transport system substrate-binding protein
MRRRDLIIGIAGSAAAWPVAARAQQAERMRRIGVLMSLAANDSEGQSRFVGFVQAMAQAGWIDGRNIRIDTRWRGTSPDLHRKHAAELVALGPDAVLAAGSLSVSALQQATRTIPIVFVGVVDPVGSGFVDSLRRPGSHTTGFMLFEYSLNGKLPELLKEFVPSLTRVAVLRDIANPAGGAQFGSIQTVATALSLEVTPINVRDASEIERDVGAFARSPNGGLIVTGGASNTDHRQLITSLANRYRLPAVYSDHADVTNGGLISYGPNRRDQYQRASSYIDRILKGEKPADLPVQVPTKYDLVINIKTAKALGLEVPPMMLARADKVIE